MTTDAGMVEVDVNTLRNNKKLCGASWKKFGKVKSQDVSKTAIKVGTASAVLEKFQEIQNPLENSREKKLLNSQFDQDRKIASTANPALHTMAPAVAPIQHFHTPMPKKLPQSCHSVPSTVASIQHNTPSPRYTIIERLTISTSPVY